MLSNSTIRESFTLPSLGKLYATEFNPKITLRSMTTEEEMKRLAYTDSEFRMMSEIIDDCILEELPISSYDMVLGDYEFLLHKLVVVTYGKDYKMQADCPLCKQRVISTVDLDGIEVHEFDQEAIDSAMEITLPVSKMKVTLAFQTPRALDDITEKTKDKRKKTKDQHTNFEFMYRVMSYISKIDGKTMSDDIMESTLRKMNMKDVYYILDKGAELGRKVGLDNEVIAKCDNCGYEFVTRFQYQSTFFRPTNNE
jgi:predicted Zn-ribbon and HTH transcriptional regulator